MKQFKIYANRQGTYEAVKRGWSWPAFFFVVLWAFVNRMWVQGFLVVAWLFVIGAMMTAAENLEQARTLTNIGGLVLCIVFGANGNKWKAKNLKSRGFAFKGTVGAEDGEAACWIVRRQVEEALKDASDIRADDS